MRTRPALVAAALLALAAALLSRRPVESRSQWKR